MAFVETSTVRYYKQTVRGEIRINHMVNTKASCGSYMGSLNNHTDQDDNGIFDTVFIHFPKDRNCYVGEKIMKWWIEKLVELGMNIEYLGIEKDQVYIKYTPFKTISYKYSLLNYSLLRYGWTEYSNIVHKVYKLHKEDPNFDLGYIISLVLSRESYFDNYDSYYSLSASLEKRILSWNELKTLIRTPNKAPYADVHRIYRYHTRVIKFSIRDFEYSINHFKEILKENNIK